MNWEEEIPLPEYGWVALLTLGPIDMITVWDHVALILMVVILAINIRRRMRRHRQ